MSYLATRIPTQWSPLADYALPEGILLRPAGRIVIETEWSQTWHDSLFFISESQTSQQHERFLKEWIPFHAFFFSGAPDIVSAYEMGKLREHTAFNRLEEIPFDGKSNGYAREYDDVARFVYWFHETALQICYRTTFDSYRQVASELRDLVALWLFPFRRGIATNLHLVMDPTYLDVMTKAIILERIIGHSESCSTQVTCPCCGKQLPHRLGSERKWKRAFLESLPMTPKARDQYEAILDAAFQEIRYRTAHSGAFPTATFPVPKRQRDTYDHERAIKEHREDSHALLGLTLGISSISRYLLLDKLFGFRFFPELPTLKTWTNDPRASEVRD